MNGYHMSQIAHFTNGQFIQNDNDDIIIHISIDSRKTFSKSSTLFFALVGERNDGHEFIDTLIENGIKNFIISDSSFVQNRKANFILVKDTLVALQKLATEHRSSFSYPVLGITGSNGKTAVKEWLAQLLSSDRQIIRSPKSYNSQVGVPLSIWQMTQNDELAIIEAGISQPGEMPKLANIIQPNWGILTNIGEAHSVNFSSNQEKLNEKLELFREAEIVFSRDKYLSLENLKKKDFKGKLVLFGNSDGCFLQILEVKKIGKSTSIQGHVRNESYSIEIPFTDQASIENACICWTVMAWMQYSPETIQERMLWLHPIAMRLELKEGIHQTTLINDTYNSDIGSLEIALDFLSQQKQHQKKSLILSDILQSKNEDKNLYQAVADAVNQRNIYRLIGIGPKIKQFEGLFELENKSFYSNTAEYLENFDFSTLNNETILIKGARHYSFEKISKRLQNKTHQTVLEISLNAIEHNLNYFKSKLQPGVRLMCMVKAFSYGSGSFEIANLLQFHNVNYLGVAYSDEGLELRKNGINLPIMVMSPDQRSFGQMILQRLEPEVHNFDLLSTFLDELDQHKLKKPYPIHLKIDTGMHRLGFEQKDMNQLISILKSNRDKIKIQSIFSHLAASDESTHDEFTQHQIQLFENISQQITQEFDYEIIRHIANSAGIQRFPNAQFDMVRLGIGLYGVGVNSNEQKKLQSVSRFVSSISEIRKIKKGDSIGYSRKGKAEKDTTIATVMLGYADGLSRALSNGVGKLYVHHQPAPIIGNVCMDMCMIDVSGIDAKIGDEVVVFDQNHPIDQLAQTLNTIPYEIMTSISSRVKRIYFQE